MRLRVLYLTVAIYLLFILSLSAQNKIDSLQLKLASYAKNTDSSLLFVHFDKNVYTNSDQVWFTAYLLKSKFADSLYNTVYVSLISNQDSAVALQESFLMKKGIALGGFNLPDSLQTGDYHFVVNTNIKNNSKPDGEFIQPIYIKSTTINPMVSSISIFKSYDEKTRNGTALLKAISSDNRFVADASVKYAIGNGTQILTNGTAKTSVIGEVMIDYPADKISAENKTLSLVIQKGNLKRYLKLDLPYKNENKYDVKFYPEGGYLVEGLESKVGFEIKDNNGAAVKSKAVLFENDLPIDTIATNPTGMGSFVLVVSKNSTYKIKLLDDAGDDKYYILPNALVNGTVAQLVSAVPKDDLIANFQSNFNTKLNIILHSNNEIYCHAALDMERNKKKRLRFKIDKIPIGLATLTVLDSNYKPLAQRIFFAHQNQINHVEIIPDSDQYATREKVTLHLKVSGENADDVIGMVSLGVTQSNRLSLSNQLNIVDYGYLQNSLVQLPTNPLDNKLQDIDYLEDILLVKTWRKYSWPSEINKKFEDNVANFEYTGAILKNNKALKIPMELSLVSNGVSFLKTDSAGKFHIPFNTIVVPKGSIWLSLNSRQFFNYKIELKNPFDELKKYYSTISYDNIGRGNRILNDAIKASPLSGIKLNDVTITNKDDGTSYLKGSSNRCGDFVCKFNILNCPNHWGDAYNRAPKKDNFYNLPGGGKVLYQGCSENEDKANFMVLKGISLPKQFYVSDVKNKDEPINFATIYWNYQTFINNMESKPVSFNTGDLIGKFKIIVQGISSKGLIYGEKEIIINKS